MKFLKIILLSLFLIVSISIKVSAVTAVPRNGEYQVGDVIYIKLLAQPSSPEQNIIQLHFKTTNMEVLDFIPANGWDISIPNCSNHYAYATNELCITLGRKAPIKPNDPIGQVRTRFTGGTGLIILQDDNLYSDGTSKVQSGIIANYKTAKVVSAANESQVSVSPSSSNNTPTPEQPKTQNNNNTIVAVWIILSLVILVIGAFVIYKFRKHPAFKRMAVVVIPILILVILLGLIATALISSRNLSTQDTSALEEQADFQKSPLDYLLHVMRYNYHYCYHTNPHLDENGRKELCKAKITENADVFCKNHKIDGTIISPPLQTPDQTCESTVLDKFFNPHGSSNTPTASVTPSVNETNRPTGTSTPTPTPTPTDATNRAGLETTGGIKICPQLDANNNGVVDADDLSVFVKYLNTECLNSNKAYPKCGSIDTDNNREVNEEDLLNISDKFNKTCQQ